MEIDIPIADESLISPIEGPPKVTHDIELELELDEIVPELLDIDDSYGNISEALVTNLKRENRGSILDRVAHMFSCYDFNKPLQ
ncbi:hypothetical protein NDU88_005833 [Pleurodeles waltl]|uniref:Uncharacterized protein n=1 Tax=Pleurodeles waltl TaxID=8319 RepID=A0AAV7RJT0_PLEWA|nr:hypothetical protein NDU88_005833 [Pleurodeles waltl]